MEIEQFKDFIDSQNWIFAKTYASFAPHEYCLKKECRDIKEFERVVKYIFENGVKEKFYSREYLYVYDRGRKYWTMQTSVNCCDIADTILINRAKVG